jgi:hypothetical protein
LTVSQSGLGAYGLKLVGLAAAEEWMQALPYCSPPLRVETTRDEDRNVERSSLDGTAADLRLVGGGRLRMRRGDERAVFSFPALPLPPDEDLLHPYLAPAAALAHMWAGREALHAGAFATSAGAVALFAEKEGGKSTTLAWLAEEHHLPVLSDDLVVLRSGAVLSGPRCLDLRRTRALNRLDRDTAHVVRNSERLRLSLPPAPSETPLIASVVLRWGPRTRLDEPAAADRLRELLPHRMYGDRLGGDPPAFLQVAALPMVIVTRPRGEKGLREAARALSDYLG